MDIFVHHSYNLDLLNLLNIAAGDAPFKRQYPELYLEFDQALSPDAKQILEKVSIALGTTLISAPIAFVLSIIPQFDMAPLIDLLLDQEVFEAALEQNEPRLLPQKKQLSLLFQVLAPVIQELESLGFREYWLTEFLPSIEERLDEIEESVYGLDFITSIYSLFQKEKLPEELHIYLCALNAQHGVRLTGHSSMVDISFTDPKIIEFGLHEAFQSAVIGLDIPALMQPLVDDPFVRLAFEKSKPVTGFENIEMYIQENVVEVCKVYILYKNGFLPDPIEYLQFHLQGAFILAVVWFDYLEAIPISTVSLDVNLRNWMEQKPVGQVMTLYRLALERAGREIGDM